LQPVNALVGTEARDSIINGGSGNIIDGSSCSHIIGGENNCVKGAQSGTIGGTCNIVQGYDSEIIGGSYNLIGQAIWGQAPDGKCILDPTGMYSSSRHAVIINGHYNAICGCTEYNTIINGADNTIFGDYSTILNGIGHRIQSGDYNTLTGGIGNTIEGVASGIFGGFCNTASGGYSMGILNGICNTVSSGYGTILNGVRNLTSGFFDTIGGGLCNQILNSEFSTILNGVQNSIFGKCSTIIGPGNNNNVADCTVTIGNSGFNAGTGTTIIGNNIATALSSAVVIGQGLGYNENSITIQSNSGISSRHRTGTSSTGTNLKQYIQTKELNLVNTPALTSVLFDTPEGYLFVTDRIDCYITASAGVTSLPSFTLGVSANPNKFTNSKFISAFSTNAVFPSINIDTFYITGIALPSEQLILTINNTRALSANCFFTVEGKLIDISSSISLSGYNGVSEGLPGIYTVYTTYE
jgi:hypothetical protein